MKLDLLKRQWIDIVFEGRNKAYGAYELRKENPKTTLRSLLIGAFIFGVAVTSMCSNQRSRSASFNISANAFIDLFTSSSVNQALAFFAEKMAELSAWFGWLRKLPSCLRAKINCSLRIEDIFRTIINGLCIIFATQR